MQKGKLYLIPVPIAEGSNQDYFPLLNKTILNSLNIFIVEDLKTARRNLRICGYEGSFDQSTFHLLNEHSNHNQISTFINEALNGHNIGLMSDAGCPGIADPGAEIILIAHQKGIQVVPLTGPSSILLALMASGLNGQSFKFHGYLPREKDRLSKKIRELEQESAQKKQTQVFIETPYRNNSLFTELTSSLKKETLLCVACNISSENELIKTRSVSEWRSSPVDLNKKPTVFLLLSR